MTLTWTAVGVIISVILHAGFVIWWASKITSKMDQLTQGLSKLDGELTKRDARIDAAWSKIDRHEHRLTVVETKVQINGGQSNG